LIWDGTTLHIHHGGTAATLLLRADKAVLLTTHGLARREEEVFLDWEDSRWRIAAGPKMGVSLQVENPAAPLAPDIHAIAEPGFSGVQLFQLTAAALGTFLQARPQARAGLASADQCEALMSDVRAFGHRRAHRVAPPREPMMGHAFDVHHAIERAIDALGVLRYARRAFEGEELPTAETVAGLARRSLGGASLNGDDDLESSVLEHLHHVTPWPFAALSRSA
jgi:hypothetical protein